MLILTRKIDESIRIGADVEVVILNVQGRQVKIGIKAPGYLAIDREEVRVRKQQEPTYVKQLREAR